MGAGSRMDAKDVAEYLKQHPKFFEDYADVLAEIFVPHPHGGHAIPIAERQILTLRERTADLEARLRELIGNGRDNDVIGEKLRGLYDSLVAEPLPDRFTRLLDELAAKERQSPPTRKPEDKS